MSRNSGLIITGSAFKTALQTIAVFLLLLVISVYFLLGSIENALHSQLKQQVMEETELLSNTYNDLGINGLQQALQQTHSSERFADVYQNGISSLTGEKSPRPNIKNIKVLSRSQLEIVRYRDGQHFAVKRTQLDTFELMVGRSTHIVNIAKQRVLFGAICMGSAFIALALLIGYIFSRRSARQLNQFEATLTHVADGDLSARLSVRHPPEQIDIIADKVNAQLQRLQRLVSRINNTSKAIAHDLKTPLSRSQIALLSALDACDNGEDSAPHVQKALDENIHLNELFETLLRISRLQSQTADKTTWTDFVLKPLLSEVIEFLSPNAEVNQQRLCLDCPEGLQAVADKAMLQQAMINLVNNAIVHSGEKTTITLSVKPIAQGLILHVCDTGKGIPTEGRDTLLEPFARLDSARHTEGNGLGLALVHAIVEFHGGTIQLEDNTPTGLCVVLSLPQR